MTEEFNLNKKRESLFNQARNDKSNKQLIIDCLQESIEKQDKEFIKRDKELFDILELHLAHIDCEGCHIRIKEYKRKKDKLAGGELIR